MAEGLHWIRFSNGKEKQIPQHLALDLSLQKQQGFEAIDGPGGKTVEGVAEQVSQKKSAVAVEGNNKAPKADEEIKEVGPAEQWYNEHKSGKTFPEIAKSNGVHYKTVESAVNKYKAEKNIVDETQTA